MNVDQVLEFTGYLYLQGRYTKAEEVLLNHLKIFPREPRILYNLALLNSIQGKFDDATRYCEQSRVEAPDFFEALDLLAHQKLRDGDFREGFRLFEARFSKSQSIPYFQFPCPVWTGSESVSRILVWNEQGLGDTVQFARFLPVLRERGHHVILLVQDQLFELLRESDLADEVFRFKDVLLTDQSGLGPNAFRVHPEFISEQKVEAHTPIMSLGRILDFGPESIPGRVPFLKVSESRLERAARQLDRICPPSLPRIGVVWAGSSSSHPEFRKIDQRRSLPLESMSDLLESQNICFLSFQKGHTAAAAYEFRNVLVPPLTESFADTAAMLLNIDLLITVDTSICHVAGGMGIPVWLMNRYDTCWRWQKERVDSPWYPSMRIFRQKALGDWSSVIASIKEVLSQV